MADSLQPDSKTEEVTYLDVSPKGSFYYKYEEYKRDSTLQNFRKKTGFFLKNTLQDFYRETIC